ncbi:MAG: 50S ribosomal protein L16 3-hydroxylase [Paracidovorax wautersii]|uniref:50S ribosomal protein L16 3-hydroxylase n=1 Tax=Paracidovorax wautersii TaxID=1177982 RepID=A0A7V8FPG4_9BURK|nr:MAG: 50S ribosomal protein L16 3-hydroxylase [Paracidovorax wautersii]
MDVNQPLALLGGLTPAQFMRRHWQKKPLLIRNAVPGLQALTRQDMTDLAERDDVESRLIVHKKQGWQLKRGPFTRRAIPPFKQPDWTLLVQGVDLHDEGVHALLQQFRFVPDARLDDVMISYASDGGGVGPHFDSYDVFLLQARGQRRWRIGAQQDLTLQEGVPLKILANFQPEEEFLLNPGDMLYLPPRYAHDGVAVGECMTYSIGFRAPQRQDVARDLLQRIAEEAEDETLYKDPRQPAAEHPALVPAALQDFAQDAVARALKDPRQIARALGEYLTEPKAQVWFDESPEAADQAEAHWPPAAGVVLDGRSRLLYDAHHIFANGESWRAAGRDAALLRRLADERALDARALKGASDDARGLLLSWLESGWLRLR